MLMIFDSQLLDCSCTFSPSYNYSVPYGYISSALRVDPTFFKESLRTPPLADVCAVLNWPSIQAHVVIEQQSSLSLNMH